MAEDPIASIARRLGFKGSEKDQVIRELHSQFEASRHDLELAGRTPEDATRESLMRFGDPGEVADMLTSVHRRRMPRIQSLLAASIALLAVSAWLAPHTIASSQNGHHEQNRVSLCKQGHLRSRRGVTARQIHDRCPTLGAHPGGSR